MLLRLLGAVALACVLASTVAEARPAKKHPRSDSQAASHCEYTNSGRVLCPAEVNRTGGDARVTARHVGKSADPRPKKWCMWWLRRHLGIPISAFRAGEENLARAGRYLGQAAHGPAIGVIVVWRHHVGIITGRRAGQWVVKSGNDSNAVRERPRSLAGAIAFRWPNGMASND